MWLRRSITIPGYAAALGLLVGLAPLILPVCLLVDLLRGSRLALTRVLLFSLTYLACELVGLLAAGVLFLLRLGPLADRRRYEWANYRLQWAWASALRKAAFTIFSIDTHVESDPSPGSAPMLLLMRHASLADTILAACFLSKPNELRLRYVLKRELLWDPCLDVVGNRIPNRFVDREAEDTTAELREVAALARGLQAGEGVLIYPEGTRFSAARRRRIIDSARSAGKNELERRALALSGVLPPRPGGTLALLDAMPDAEVWIGNHRGLEAATSFGDLLSGALVGAHVHVEFRRVERPGAGSDPAACRRWLDELWLDVDRFVMEKAPHA